MSHKPITQLEEADYETLKAHIARIEGQNAVFKEQSRQYDLLSLC